MKQLILLLTLCYVSLAWGAPPPPESHGFMIIDARAVSDNDLANLFTAAASAYKRADWITVSYSPTTSLTAILESQYNLTVANKQLYPATYKQVMDMILSVNRIDQVPPQISIPRLPSIPNISARSDSVQLQHFAGLYTVIGLKDLSFTNLNEQSLPISLSQASTIAFLDTQELRDVLKLQTNASLHKPDFFQGGRSLGRFRLHPLSAPSPCDDRIAHSVPIQYVVSDSLKARVSQISPASAGYLYIVDFDFGVKCSHGAKVKNVVDQVLMSYGADKLLDNVKTIDLDYFANPQQARDLVTRILNDIVDNYFVCQYKVLFANSFGQTLGSCTTELAALALPPPTKPSEDPEVPGFYLWLVFQYLLDSHSSASVVSNSYYTDTGGAKLLTGIKYRQWPALVAAVLDPDPDNLLPNHVDELHSEDPARSFFELSPLCGTFLIGAVLRDGSIYGMTSQGNQEDDVGALTALAPGDGYGRIDSLSKKVLTDISPDDKGTSFAAPAIATELFLARELWTSERLIATQQQGNLSNAETSVMEARRRLNLSATVVSDYIGKAGSAGIPSIEKFLVSASGKTDILTTADGKSLNLRVEEAAAFLDNEKLPLSKGTFDGIQVRDGRLYLYDERVRAWRLSDHDFLYLKLSDDRAINSVSEFASQFSSLVRYNP